MEVHFRDDYDFHVNHQHVNFFDEHDQFLNEHNLYFNNLNQFVNQFDIDINNFILMKSVKNTATTPLEIGIEGIDYTFPPGVAVACEDNIADFIKGQFELFEVERLSAGKAGDAFPKVQTKKSKVYIKQEIPNQSMFVKPRGKMDDTMPQGDLPAEGKVDADGVEWTGKGIEFDSLNS